LAEFVPSLIGAAVRDLAAGPHIAIIDFAVADGVLRSRRERAFTSASVRHRDCYAIKPFTFQPVLPPYRNHSGTQASATTAGIRLANTWDHWEAACRSYTPKEPQTGRKRSCRAANVVSTPSPMTGLPVSLIESSIMAALLTMPIMHLARNDAANSSRPTCLAGGHRWRSSVDSTGGGAA
jgi:hypothetical protein